MASRTRPLNFTIRTATAGDAPKAVALITQLGRPGPDEIPLDALVAVFEEIFETEAVTIFVAEAAGRLVGLACLVIRPRLNWTTPEAVVNELVVDTRFRGLGIARALLDVCTEAARSRRCRLLRLTAARHRTEAHRLYERYGFEHAGRDYQLAL